MIKRYSKETDPRITIIGLPPAGGWGTFNNIINATPKPTANGKVKNWLDSNIENLSKHKYLLSKNNLKIINNFSKARRSKNLFLRLFYFYRSGVYRQSSIENFVFIIGIIFKKI